jgi:hypothetical protein
MDVGERGARWELGSREGEEESQGRPKIIGVAGRVGETAQSISDLTPQRSQKSQVLEAARLSRWAGSNSLSASTVPS